MKLLEWLIKTGLYAGRALTKSVDSEHIILWFYMQNPVPNGLIWTMPSGDTFLNGQKMGVLPIHGDFSKVTHRVVLQHFSERLNTMDVDVWDYLESNQNTRGRIIKDVIYVYDEDTSRSVNMALNNIRKYIKEGWWT